MLPETKTPQGVTAEEIIEATEYLALKYPLMAAIFWDMAISIFASLDNKEALGKMYVHANPPKKFYGKKKK